jgi:predicted dehydrogenase
VVRVSSEVAQAALQREVEDTAVALLHFARGATAVVATSNAAADRQDTLDLFGTRGSIRVASLNEGTIAVRADGVERIETHPPASNVHLPLVEDFLDAIRTARAPSVDGDDGRAVARIQDAIYAHTPTVR